MANALGYTLSLPRAAFAQHIPLAQETVSTSIIGKRRSHPERYGRLLLFVP
jgi:hypothetical protein